MSTHSAIVFIHRANNGIPVILVSATTAVVLRYCYHHYYTAATIVRALSYDSAWKDPSAFNEGNYVGPHIATRDHRTSKALTRRESYRHQQQHHVTASCMANAMHFLPPPVAVDFAGGGRNQHRHHC